MTDTTSTARQAEHRALAAEYHRRFPDACIAPSLPELRRVLAQGDQDRER